MDAPASLLLVSLPAGATPRDLDYATVLGTRTVVAARIADLLPGTAFDANGRGTFRRSGYEIAFSFRGAEPTAIEVRVDRPEAFTALGRVVGKTGWQVVDPAAGVFVDLEASRVAGTVVPVAAASARETAVTEPKPPAWRARVGQAALVVAFAAATWIAWEWSRRVPGIPRSTTPASVDAIVSAVSSARASATPGGRVDPNAAATAVMQQLALATARMRSRMQYIKYLAPEFRDDPIVHQMLDYRMASAVFPNTLGETGFLPPECLSDAAFFAQLQTAAPLPPSFAKARRDGYEFAFDGRNCSRQPKHLQILGTLCDGFVYSARPLDGSRAGAPSYAYFSTDDRIHYRGDGVMPTRSDPTVDNTTPSTAADLPGGAAPPEKTDYTAIPQDPGPAGRRSFALYPDAIFAAAERRAPNRKDTPIGLR